MQQTSSNNKRRSHNRYLSTLLALSLLTPVAHADDELQLSDTKDAAGFGIGAIIGALAAGPIGAAAGAVGGAWLGARDIERDAQSAELQGDLAARTAELEQLRSELVALEDRNDKLQTVRLEQRQDLVRQSAEQLSQAINLSVYFRTDSSDVNAETGDRLQELATYLAEYPQIRVHVAGHADRRGSPTYNLRLSKRRAESVAAVLRQAGIEPQRIHVEAHGQAGAQANDIEGYMFDRRVNIALSVNDPV